MQPNRNLLVPKLDPPQSWNLRVENYLRATGFYHVSRIGMIRGFHPLLAALVERWRSETHTFVLPVGEVTVTLEDVAHIFGLPIDGEPVSGWTDSSSDFVQSQSMAIFGRQPVLSRSTLFTDKLTAYAHAKYLPLLRDFERIHTYSWGSACLAHLYRALCRASRYDTKEMDGPLNLLFVWAWGRMPCIAPVPMHSQHSHHSQHSQPMLTIPIGHDWFDFSISGHGDQQLQNWANASLGGWSDFSAMHSPSASVDPRGTSVGMSDERIFDGLEFHK
ncbi:hypothetical protein Ahy_B10g101797 isoform A [Arachis hypogaea]|uniref:Aminotransferase-like plant mobile domain-containing protein n=1 Tax=Arachis hypogaea TaxID=3818 RepID=A0A444X0I1_ARAHY|nr:hypothetical protein Ahy_B10g101797 isoform A [Arachis hypogaea]